MARHRIEIVLDDDDEKLVDYMVKEHFYGECSKTETLKSIFYLQLREDMDCYGAEAGVEGRY